MNKCISSAGRLLRASALAPLSIRFFLALAGLSFDVSAQADMTAAKTSVGSGNTSYAAADYVSAENWYSNAIAQQPTWALPYNNRGLARFRQGNFSSAEADFDAAKSRDTNYMAPYLNNGKCLAAERRFTNAIAELQTARSMASTNASVYYNLGWIYDEQGNFADALTNFTQALTRNPAHNKARLARGITHAKRNEVTEAVADFYGVINGVASGDMLAAIAAYNLQHLRGPGLVFNSAEGQTNYLDGLFKLATEQFGGSVSNFTAVQSREAVLPDAPWMKAWSYLESRDSASGNAALQQANALLKKVKILSLGPAAKIFIDGISKGTTPYTATLFPSRYDLFLRATIGTAQPCEWIGPLFTDGTLTEPNVVVPSFSLVGSYTPFGPLNDFHAVSSLIVQATGGSTVSPNYSNAVLAWRCAYTMTAKPGPGFTYINWTKGVGGPVVTNNPTVQFVMQSGLVLTANSAEGPTLMVSASLGTGGTVSGDGTFTEGSVRTVTATSDAGFAFVNWTENGTVVSRSASYTFTVNRDRTLVANFVSGSFAPVKGTYSGLFYAAEEVAQPSSGSFSITTTAKGTLSGSLQISGTRYSVSGKFGGGRRFTQTVRRGKVSLFTVQLQTDPADADRMIGTVTAADGSWTAELGGDRAVFSRATNPTRQAGKYTVVFPGSPGSTSEPGGNGYGTVSVDTAGKINMAGSLADGTTMSQSGVLSKDGQWPLRVSLYSGKGSLLGWLTFTATGTNNLGGWVNWIKPAGRSKYYSDGFTVQTPATGSQYEQPAKGASILSFSNGYIRFTGDSLGRNVVIPVTLGANRVTSANKAKLTFTLSTGAFKGSAPNPAGGSPKTISFSGVVLQKQNLAKGYFLGTGQSGEVILGP